MVRCEVLEEGEEALLYHFNGKVTHKKGPKRLWLFASDLKRLQRFTAHHDEFLAINHLNGSTEHRIGPVSEVLNTLLYSSITVKKCYCLDSNQAIIVYRKNDIAKEQSALKVNIIRGPGIFMLQPDEWAHKFSWHGEDPNHKTRFIANSNRFEVLNCAPDQLYYNVDEVRTSDDALIRIKLMIFYELKNIHLMLSETKDPIADFLNCCCADVISFTAKRTYLNFIETCFLLNNLNEYPKLMERAKKIGFEITKVVFRGYFASPKLQTMHDSSIQKRTELKLEYESEIQQQEQLNFNLKNEMDRLTTEQELEFQKLKNELELERLKKANEQRNVYEEKKRQIELQRESRLKELENLAKQNEQKLEHLEKLNRLKVDLTSFLVTSLTIPDKHVQIKKNQVSDLNQNFSNIHFHE